MALVILLVFFFPFHLHLLLVGADSTECPQSFPCANFSLEFPFTNTTNPGCGMIMVHGCDSESPKIISESTGHEYTILEKITANKFFVQDTQLQGFLNNKNCPLLRNLSMPQVYPLSFTFSPNITLFKCFNRTRDDQIQEYFRNYSSFDCQSSFRTVLYGNLTADSPDDMEERVIPTECSMIQLPLNPNAHSDDLFTRLTPNFTLEWSVPEGCNRSKSGNEYDCKEGIICYNFDDLFTSCYAMNPW